MTFVLPLLSGFLNADPHPPASVDQSRIPGYTAVEPNDYFHYDAKVHIIAW